MALSRRRKIVIGLIGLVLGGFLAVFSIFFFIYWRPEQALQAAMAYLDEIDPDWRFEAIEAKRPDLRPEENGALQVLAVAAALPKDWPVWIIDADIPRKVDEEKEEIYKLLMDKTWYQVPREALPPRALELLRSELKRAGQALEKAKSLEKYSDGRYSITYRLDGRTNTGDLTKVTTLLQANGLAWAHKGEAEEVCKIAWILLKVARFFGDDGSLGVSSSRRSIVVSAVEMMRQGLACGEAKKETLEQLQHWFKKEDEETPALFLHTMRMERALLHRRCQAAWRGQLNPRAAWSGNNWEKAILELGLIPISFRYQHAEFLRESPQVIEGWTQPLNSFSGPRPASMSLWELFVRTGEIHQKIMVGKQAHLRCAYLALAAERFRLDHGRWPATLDELVPQYVKEVPQDLFQAAPLKLVRTDDGLRIYSVGPDGQDNGGAVDWENRFGEGTDIVFVLWDKQHRGLRKSQKK